MSEISLRLAINVLQIDICLSNGCQKYAIIKISLISYFPSDSTHLTVILETLKFLFSSRQRVCTFERFLESTKKSSDFLTNVSLFAHFQMAFNI